MNNMNMGTARAVADLAEGNILATVEVATPPERVFKALTSKEIIAWWFRAGVFNVTDWRGELHVGGRWQASGIARGRPYTMEGEYLRIDPVRKVEHTYHLAGTPDAPTTVSYLLEQVEGGTRLTLRHTGFSSRASCSANCLGWEACFERLAEYLAPESVSASA